jgi:hypothetical protein
MKYNFHPLRNVRAFYGVKKLFFTTAISVIAVASLAPQSQASFFSSHHPKQSSSQSTKGTVSQPSYPWAIYLTTPANRSLNGDFFTDSLIRTVSAIGVEGKYVLNSDGRRHTWFIDPSFLDDVKALADGGVLQSGKKIPADPGAKAFLTALPTVIGNDPVYALPYGNPSGYWIHRLLSKKAALYLSFSNTQLATYLPRKFTPVGGFGQNWYYHLPSPVVSNFDQLRNDLELIAPYMAPAELQYIELHLAAAFYQNLSKSTLSIYSNDLNNVDNELLNRVSLSPGKFTLTSAHEKLPVTVSNHFPKQISVKVEIAALNSRISTPSSITTTVPGNSKTQIFIPIKALASGSSAMQLSVFGKDGTAYGQTITYPISLSILSPVATWITTIATVLLFAAVIVRSIRKRRKHSPQEEPQEGVAQENSDSAEKTDSTNVESVVGEADTTDE